MQSGNETTTSARATCSSIGCSEGCSVGERTPDPSDCISDDDITTVSVCAILVAPISVPDGTAPKCKEELNLFWKTNQEYGGLRYRKNYVTPQESRLKPVVIDAHKRLLCSILVSFCRTPRYLASGRRLSYTPSIEHIVG